MSKRHQASRRRSYGRRQHELRERIDRSPESPFDATDELDAHRERLPFGRFELALAGPGLAFLGID